MKRKKIITFAVCIICSVNIYSQELNTMTFQRQRDVEKVEIYTTRISEPIQPKIMLNYLSSDELKNKIVIESIPLKNRILPRNGEVCSNVTYSIKRKYNDDEILVFSDIIEGQIKNRFERFITEAMLFEIAVPYFEWNGNYNQELDGYPGLINPEYEKKVSDGEYVLTVKIENAVKGSKDEVLQKGSFLVESLDIPIEIDTTQPRIVSEIIRENKDPYSGIYYYWLRNHQLSEEDREILFWEIKENGVEIFSGKATNPVIALEHAVAGEEIEVIARDDFYNYSDPCILTIPDDSEYTAFVQNRNKLAYTNIVRAAMEKGIRNDPTWCIIDSVSKEYKIPAADMRIVNSSESKVPLKLLIGQNRSLDLKINDNNIYFSIDKDLIPQGGDYPLFLSDKHNSSTMYLGTVRIQTTIPFVSLKVESNDVVVPVLAIEDNLILGEDDKENYVLSCWFEPLTLDESDLGWNLELYDSKNKIMEVNSGSGFTFGKNGFYNWDGYDKNGNFIFSSSKFYTVKLNFDNGVSYSSETGNRIVTRIGFDGQQYIDLPDIIFPGSKESFIEDPELYQMNLPTLESIAKVINDNKNNILYVDIMGYANPEYVGKGEKALQKENNDVLIPLSKKRADYIKEILVLMGVPSSLLRIKACGGLPYEANPLNKDENWKNRRVRFNVVTK